MASKRRYINPDLIASIAIEKGWKLELVNAKTKEWDFVKTIKGVKYKSNSNGKELYKEEVLNG